MDNSDLPTPVAELPYDILADLYCRSVEILRDIAKMPLSRIVGDNWDKRIAIADIFRMPALPHTQRVSGEWVSRADVYRVLRRVVKLSITYLPTDDSDITERLRGNPGVNNLSDLREISLPNGLKRGLSPAVGYLPRGQSDRNNKLTP